SAALAISMAGSVATSLLPTMQTITYAEQSSSGDYKDPVDSWTPTNNRANEFDLNAVKTVESNMCLYCGEIRLFDVFRVPEYTSNGDSAADRGALYTNGDKALGSDVYGKYTTDLGDIDDPTPTENSKFTQHHWTKSYCPKCHKYNTNLGYSAKWDGTEHESPNGTHCAASDENLYVLNVCDSNFFSANSSTQFTNDEIEAFEDYHTIARKKGQYCMMCKGSPAVREAEIKEDHSFNYVTDSEVGNHRFKLDGVCEVCGWEETDTVVAKTVVADYYGKVDGQSHTVQLADYSDSGVSTSIKYGTTQNNVTSLTAPSFSEAGTYDVWYNIKYTYTPKGRASTTSFEDNGCAKVILYNDTYNSGNAELEGVHTHDFEYRSTVLPTSTTLGYEIWQCSGCGEIERRNEVATTPEDTHNMVYKYRVDASCTGEGYEVWQCANCGTIEQRAYKAKTSHNMQFAWKVDGSCTDLGYDVYQCSDCGKQEKRNYTNASGHNYEKTVLREATCDETGIILAICSKCKDSYTEEVPVNPNNHVNLKTVEDPAATCEKGGKSYNRCDACGYSVLVDVEDALGHTWNTLYTVAPTCTEGGYTVEQCAACKNIRNVNHTEATGHAWSEKGIVISDATCAADGLKEYLCDNCGDRKYEAISAAGHTPGAEATCTEPQTCTVCGTILKLPTGHHDYEAVVTAPTCTAMGFTTYTCADGDHTYVADYTDKIDHTYAAEVHAPTCTELGYTTYTCTACGDTHNSDYVEVIPHSYAEEVVAPTCTGMGYTIYTCTVCGDSYKGSYTDILPHNYNKQVIPPTCVDCLWRHTKII
ncbi:MAG: hypothetical protein Q4G33_12000, partial [bacterium]|nr:hypothetical protein [bacterium]